MSDMPEWMKSEDGMRAEIDRRLALAMFPYILADEIEDAIDDELIIQGTGDESKWPAARITAVTR